MKEAKAEIIRKVLIVITVILIFTTFGLLLITTQTKTVVLDYYGDIKSIKTLSGTIDAFLLQNKISINENTVVYPDKNTVLTDGMTISIYSVNESSKFNLDDFVSDYNPIVAKVEEVVEPVPFSEETKDNEIMNRGTSNVLQEGINGEKVTKYLVKYTNDIEIARKQIDTVVTLEAQNRIVEVGTKIVPVVSRSSVVTSIRNTNLGSDFKVYNIKLPQEEQEYAYKVCKRYGIEYELFLAVMYKESGYNRYALGGGNSYGLCQIHVSNHASLRNKLGISDYYNPYDNMTAGAYLLSLYFGNARKQQTTKEGIEAYALNSYNMGEGVFIRNCYSKGVLNREYSNSIRSLRDRLVINGGL